MICSMHSHVHCSIVTIAKIWKQPKCPRTEEWIKKKKVVVYIFSGILVIKKNEIMPFATT